jgi:hypothetical protein
MRSTTSVGQLRRDESLSYDRLLTIEYSVNMSTQSRRRYFIIRDPAIEVMTTSS